jgi:hypothetical protein
LVDLQGLGVELGGAAEGVHAPQHVAEPVHQLVVLRVQLQQGDAHAHRRVVISLAREHLHQLEGLLPQRRVELDGLLEILERAVVELSVASLALPERKTVSHRAKSHLTGGDDRGTGASQS